METLTTMAFVKHGQVYNPRNVYHGRLPRIKLNEQGQAQACSGGLGYKSKRREMKMVTQRNSLLWTVLSRLPKIFIGRGLYTDEGGKPGKSGRGWIARLRGRSVFIRHLDTGSSNGIELSINALQNPRYDIERLGLHFVASPRHADLLLVTGPMNYNMIRAAEATFDAIPDRRRHIVTVGDDTEGGGIFRHAYGVLGCLSRDDMQAAFIGHIAGPVPKPHNILVELRDIVDAHYGR